MYVIVHEEMTSIIKCRTTFCGACQCHRILMPSSCFLTPFPWYILNIHAYIMYLVTMRKRSTPVQLLNTKGSASHKETEHFDMSRPWLFCLLYILVHINVCQCLWNQYFYCDLIPVMRSRTRVYLKPTICSKFAASMQLQLDSVALYHLFIGQ